MQVPAFAPMRCVSATRAAWSSALGSCLSIAGTKWSMTALKSSCAAASVLNNSSSGKMPSSQAVATEVGRTLRHVDVAVDALGAELPHEVPEHERTHRPADQHRALEPE